MVCQLTKSSRKIRTMVIAPEPIATSGADRRGIEGPKNPERGRDERVEILFRERGSGFLDGNGLLELDPGLAAPVLVHVRELDRLGQQVRPQDEDRQRLLG